MRVAHQRSWQSCAAVGVLLASLGGCASNEPAPSIWPPPDFRCELEEATLRDGALQIVRRVRFESSGLVVYGTSSRSLIDDTTKVALPVFDRLAIYQLVPDCMRAMAREIHGRGVTSIDATQGERGAAGDTGLALRWRAFGSERVLTVRGRVHGQMAQILGVIASMLPQNERFTFSDADGRAVVSRLRAVPEPVVDVAGALQAHEELLRDGEDPAWLLDAFSLACRAGRREAAESLLRRWSDREATRRVAGSFPDESREKLTAETLRRLLPPQGSG